MSMKIAVVLVSVAVVFLLLGLTFVNQPNQPFSEQAKLKRFASYEELNNYVKSNAGTSYGGYLTGERAMATTAAETGVAQKSDATSPAPSAAGSSDYSTTNVQVTGVDEPDIVKNDGKYIYVVSGSNISIVDAYPAESARIVSVINLDGVREMFVNGDKLVVFGQDYNTGPVPIETVSSKIAIMPPYRYSSDTYVKVYDISERSSPQLAENLSFSGNYLDSRMIGDYVYIIINQPAAFYGDVIPLPRIMSNGVAKEIAASDIYYFDVPDYSYQFTMIASLNVNTNDEPNSKVIMTGYTENTYVSADNIYITYMKQVSNIYMTDRVLNDAIIPSMPADIAARLNEVKISNASASEKTERMALILQEYSNTLTEEQRNTLQQKIMERMAAIQAEIAKEMEKTVVHRISIDNGNIEDEATGEVPGRILNQFSMDEYNNYFRVATTTHGYYYGYYGGWGVATNLVQPAVAERATQTVSSGSGSASAGQAVAEPSTAEPAVEETTVDNAVAAQNVEEQPREMNHVYVLDLNLNTVGKLEDIAKGESIYSARFMGERAYLVTFRQVDPLFVIDLSNPSSPQVLGQLKIPGYSNYLHPYDESHVIGIGKDVDESIDAEKVHTPGAIYYTAIKGVKISLFDVSDVAHPVEMSKYVVGDRGTDSLALNDHKAFLFDKNKNLLVIPILLAEMNDPQSEEVYGQYTFQGAYVFNIDLSGVTLRGRITHQNSTEDFAKAGFYYYGDASAVKRALYIGNVLYTISNKLIKANDLTTLSEISSVALPYENEYYPLYYGGGVRAV